MPPRNTGQFKAQVATEGIAGHKTIDEIATEYGYNTPGRIRTCDLRIRNPLLYPTELRALFS